MPDAWEPSVVPGTLEAPANRWLLYFWELYTPVLRHTGVYKSGHHSRIGNKSQSWQRDENSQHQSQRGENSRQQVLTGKIPGLDCKES